MRITYITYAKDSFVLVLLGFFPLFPPLWKILIYVYIFLGATSVIHRRELILIKSSLACTFMYFCKHVCIVYFIFSYFHLQDS